jgi:hypothetical protein
VPLLMTPPQPLHLDALVGATFCVARARMDSATAGKSNLVFWSCADQPKSVWFMSLNFVM